MRILIVEDDLTNITIIQEYLVDEEYEILVANDGKEALDVLEKNDVDIILLDRMMPGMDGMEFMEKFNNDDRFNDVPVVIMQTAATDVPEVIEGVQTGIFYYLTKPYSEDLLLSVVRAAAEKIEALSIKK